MSDKSLSPRSAAAAFLAPVEPAGAGPVRMLSREEIAELVEAGQVTPIAEIVPRFYSKRTLRPERASAIDRVVSVASARRVTR